MANKNLGFIAILQALEILLKGKLPNLSNFNYQRTLQSLQS